MLTLPDPSYGLRGSPSPQDKITIRQAKLKFRSTPGTGSRWLLKEKNDHLKPTEMQAFLRNLWSSYRNFPFFQEGLSRRVTARGEDLCRMKWLYIQVILITTEQRVLCPRVHRSFSQQSERVHLTHSQRVGVPAPPRFCPLRVTGRYLEIWDTHSHLITCNPFQEISTSFLVFILFRWWSMCSKCHSDITQINTKRGRKASY